MSQAAMEIAETTRFFSQIATLWPGRHSKISYEKPAHADLHAEYDEGGCKRNSKIGEKLVQKTSSLDWLPSPGHRKTHIYRNQPPLQDVRAEQGVG
jgi:hypothetical protein